MNRPIFRLKLEFPMELKERLDRVTEKSKSGSTKELFQKLLAIGEVIFSQLDSTKVLLIADKKFIDACPIADSCPVGTVKIIDIDPE